MRPATASLSPISSPVLPSPSVLGDFSLADHGSVVLLRPMTETACDWLVDNVVCDPPRIGEVLRIQPRYASAILHAILREGFVVL